MKLKIKPQRGVTYECYVGYTDDRGNRVRKGQRYYLYASGEFRGIYVMSSISDRGDFKIVETHKFPSHFVPVNPLNCCDE